MNIVKEVVNELNKRIFYVDVGKVTDEEVLKILTKNRNKQILRTFRIS